jgi:hypothetical protein
MQVADGTFSCRAISDYCRFRQPVVKRRADRATHHRDHPGVAGRLRFLVFYQLLQTVDLRLVFPMPRVERRREGVLDRW